MKKRYWLFAITLLLLGAGFTATAQEDEAAALSKTIPRWVSSKGYWMVESNISEPRHARVYFYTNDNISYKKAAYRNRLRKKLLYGDELL